MKVVQLYSGGLDSTVLLYWLRGQGHDVKALGVHYGQRHCKELQAAMLICSGIGVSWELVGLADVARLFGGSSLTDRTIEVPEGHYEDEKMKATIVPNRNMVLLSIAVGYAIAQGFEVVAYGAHQGDYAIYPDCRSSFLEKMQSAIKEGNWEKIELTYPMIDKTKSDIVLLGHELGVPFDKTWTCYGGERLHCGRCGACGERKEAFELAGVVDPTEYEG